jgi:hypothetical protein
MMNEDDLAKYEFVFSGWKYPYLNEDFDPKEDLVTQAEVDAYVDSLEYECARERIQMRHMQAKEIAQWLLSIFLRENREDR